MCLLQCSYESYVCYLSTERSVTKEFQVSVSGQEDHKLAPRLQFKKISMGGIFEFLSPPRSQIFLLHVLTCNSNKQQEVEDRVLDIISFILQLSLRRSGFHNITINKRNKMLASIVLLSAVGTASSLGTTIASFLMLNFI